MSEADRTTYGKAAVGLSFNPSGDPDVHHVKLLCAELIDFCAQARTNATSTEQARLFSVAITETQTAQMWAVKAITWKD